jgi:hypothetical protein
MRPSDRAEQRPSSTYSSSLGSDHHPLQLLADATGEIEGDARTSMSCLSSVDSSDESENRSPGQTHADDEPGTALGRKLTTDNACERAWVRARVDRPLFEAWRVSNLPFGVQDIPQLTVADCAISADALFSV